MVMAGRKAIEAARKRSKHLAGLHQQIEESGAIENYDKAKIDLYMSGKIQRYDVAGEEPLADMKVKLKHERAPEEL